VKRLMTGAFLLLAALFTTGAGQDWTTVATATADAHVVGNPDAAVRLTEYVSYTCPHCSHFTQQSDAPLKLSYIAPGRLSLEIRHLIRDPVDLTVALLTNCGPAARFVGNHNAFMLGQPQWIGAMGEANAAQRQRWTTGPESARRRAIAADFGFYPIMERRGYSRAQADRCLNDTAKATRLAETSAADWRRPGIEGTPAFAINGVVLAGTHDWAMLQTQLAARY